MAIDGLRYRRVGARKLHRPLHPLTRDERRVLHRRRTAGYYVVYVSFLLVWCAMLLGFEFYKAVADGPTIFFSYLTNLTWTFCTIFWTLELLCVLSVVVVGYELTWLRIVNINFIFWPTESLVWLVYFLILLLYHDNSAFLINISTLGGGSLPFWEVLWGTSIFHGFIGSSVLVYGLLEKERLKDSVSPFLDWRHARGPGFFRSFDWKSVLYLIYVVGVPFLILGIYAAVWSPYSVYGITTSMAVVVPIAIGIVLIFTFLPVFASMACFEVPKTKLYRHFDWTCHWDDDGTEDYGIYAESEDSSDDDDDDIDNPEESGDMIQPHAGTPGGVAAGGSRKR